MKHDNLMQWTGDLCQILSLRSTQVTVVQSTRETGDIDGGQKDALLRRTNKKKLSGIQITAI